MPMRESRYWFIAAGISAGVLITGCRSTPKVDQPLLLFPPPPAKPRVQFLTWANGEDEVGPKRSSFDDWLLGEGPRARRVINKPYGLAARDGAVYVCDTKGLSLCKLDFKNSTYSVLGTSGPGRLRKPINVIIDTLGYKFVADPIRKQVVVFGPDDNYVAAFDIPQPCHPVDVALYQNELYVLDNDDTCQVVVLNRSTGEVLDTIGGPGMEPGQFKIPSSLCIGPEGYLYVSDTLNWRIQKLTRKGEPVWTKGAPGYRLSEFGRPRGIRAGPDGIVYVVDAATEIVQMFDPDGRILMCLGGPGSVPGAMALPSQVAIDTTSIPYFQKYVHEKFNVEYLLFVANQYGAYMVGVYAFGSFPEGFKLSEGEVATLPPLEPKQGQGIGAPPIPTTAPIQPSPKEDRKTEAQD